MTLLHQAAQKAVEALTELLNLWYAFGHINAAAEQRSRAAITALESALQHQEVPRELVARIDRETVIRLAREAVSNGDGSELSGDAIERFAQLVFLEAASPSTTQQQEAIDRFNEQQIALHQQITATQQPSVAAHALNTTPVVDHATQQQEVGSGAQYRHKRTGGLYAVIGTAKLQTDKPLFDMAEVVAYRGEDGRVWVRAAAEFDERFERAAAPSTPENADGGPHG